QAVPTAGMRVEDCDSAVTFDGVWTQTESGWGWGGGTAVRSNAARATGSLSFVGTSVRWIGSRGRGMGIANMSVDGGPVREVDLFPPPTDEAHTSIAATSHPQHTRDI